MRETVEELLTNLKEEIATCCKRTILAMLAISVMMYFILMCCFYVEGLTSENRHLGNSDYYYRELALEENDTDNIDVDIDEALTKVAGTLDGMLE